MHLKAKTNFLWYLHIFLKLLSSWWILKDICFSRIGFQSASDHLRTSFACALVSHMKRTLIFCCCIAFHTCIILKNVSASPKTLYKMQKKECKTSSLFKIFKLLYHQENLTVFYKEDLQIFKSKAYYSTVKTRFKVLNTFIEIFFL